MANTIKWAKWIDELRDLAVKEYGFKEDYCVDDFDCDAWQEYYAEGYSPRDALEEDLSNG
jgi:hypothetical protein